MALHKTVRILLPDETETSTNTNLSLSAIVVSPAASKTVFVTSAPF